MVEHPINYPGPISVPLPSLHTDLYYLNFAPVSPRCIRPRKCFLLLIVFILSFRALNNLEFLSNAQLYPPDDSLTIPYNLINLILFSRNGMIRARS